MEKVVQFCKTKDQFSIDELVTKIGPLEKEQEAAIKLVRLWVKKQGTSPLLDAIRWSFYENDEKEYVWERLDDDITESNASLVLAEMDLTKKDVMNYLGQAKDFTELFLSAIADMGFVRKDIRMDERINGLLVQVIFHHDEKLKEGCLTLYDYLCRCDAYETYEPREDFRVGMVMEFVKDYLPKNEYIIFKDHFKNKWIRCSEIKGHSLDDNSIIYTESERDLLRTAVKNANKFHEEIRDILFS